MSFASFQLLEGETEKLLLCLVLFLLCNFCLWTFKTFALRKTFKKYPSFTGSLAQHSRPIDLLVFAISLSLSLQMLPERFRAHPLNIYGAKIILIVVALWISERIVKMFLARPNALGMSNEASRSLVLQVCRLLIAGLGLLIVLDTVGISITPLLASLGVSSIAIALALQDTLSNFIAGVYILIDQPIRIGDTVKAPEGAEGLVRKIGWRSTHIENGLGHTVIVPNSKLSSAIITNYDLPSQEVSIAIFFSVDFSSDLELVEQLTREVLSRTIQNQSACLKHINASFAYSQTTSTGIEAQVSLRVQKISDSSQVKSYFLKNLAKDFAKSNIKFAQSSRI